MILVVPLVVEQLIFRLSFAPALEWLRPAVEVLPFTAGQHLLAIGEEVAGTEARQGYLFDRWASGGVFAAFVAVIVIAAWYLFKSRDA